MILYNGFDKMKAIPSTASTGGVTSFYYGTASTTQTTREEWFTRTKLGTQSGIIDLRDADGYVPLSNLATVFSAYDTIRVTARVTNYTGAALRIREIAIGSGTTDLFTRDVVDTTIAAPTTTGGVKTTAFVYKITYRPHDWNNTWTT